MLEDPSGNAVELFQPALGRAVGMEQTSRTGERGKLWVPDEPTWWQRGIVYQIYPRSFRDASGDGVGDLAGIREKADYLAWLGIDAVWLSPIYPSPDVDLGYDISDYRNIHPAFGTLEDFDALVAALHEREIKLILDLVPNHTSDQHSWFLESRDPDSARHDWYVWREGRPDGSRPNNWVSYFGEPGVALPRSAGQVVPALLRSGAAGPELGQPGGAGSDPRRDAVLARPGRRRVPGRRAVAPREGPGAPRQPTEPRLARRAAVATQAAPRPLRGRPGCARPSAFAARGDRRVPRSGHDRGAGPASRPSRDLPRCGSRRGAHAAQLRADRAPRVDRRCGSSRGRGVRSGAARRRVAELAARGPRLPAHREPGRTGAGPAPSHAPADAPRNARPGTTGTSSDSRTPSSPHRRRRSRIPRPPSERRWTVFPFARRCSGHPVPTPASPSRNRGCRSRRTIRR